MAWFDNLKNALHPYDDEYIENEAAAAEEEFADDAPIVQQPVMEEEDYTEERPALRSVFGKREAKAAPQEERSSKMKLVFVSPREFDEAVEIADNLRSRRAVLMNLEACDSETSRRLLDFMSGVAYALGGKVTRVSSKAFIVTPLNVDLVGDALQDFENYGIHF